jgi:hypothetical protein
MPGLPFNNLPATQQEIPFGQSGSMTYNPKQFEGPVIQQPQQKRFDPVSIVEGEIALGQRQINQQFDQAKHELDVQTYKNPEDYLNAINELRGKAGQAGLKLRQKGEAKLYSMKQMAQLVKEGNMPKEAGQRAIARIAGLSDEQVDAMLPESKPRNLIQEHTALAGEIKRLQDTTDLLAEKNGKLYHADKNGEPLTDDPATDQETNEYLSAKNLYGYYLDKEQELFNQMSPGLQSAVVGQKAAMEQIAKTKRPNRVLTALEGISPLWAIHNIKKISKQTKELGVSKGTLDSGTARKILTEAGGDRERARQIAKERGYTF